MHHGHDLQDLYRLELLGVHADLRHVPQSGRKPGHVQRDGHLQAECAQRVHAALNRKAHTADLWRPGQGPEHIQRILDSLALAAEGSSRRRSPANPMSYGEVADNVRGSPICQVAAQAER